MAGAKSYLDPSYAQLSQQMEERFKLPSGLLHAIVTKGERSNADQVSEAGAKTVFQVIPATRKAALEKWGIDAYLSAENAAEVAARLLKDSLDRNGGDVKAAVGEYHGGTDRANWKGRTKAYIGRVVGGSTFDRVKAKREEAATPSIAKVYDAYKAGLMSPEEKAQFEADVTSGAVLLPRGAKLATPPKTQAQVLPPGVVQAYNNHSEMTDGERAMLDQDVAAGLVQLPQGVTLQRPARRGAGEMVGMGARNVLEGAGGLVDIAAGPMGAVMDAVIPGDAIAPDPARRLMGGLSDALGLATPETKQEQLIGSIVEGGTQGVLTSGLGMVGAGAKGATGAVARGLAENPITDVVASAAGAGAMEKADQSGVGPVGQLALGVLAGGGAGVGVKVTERVAARFGAKAAKVVETVPREVLIDQKGALTEEGREVANANDLTPDDVKGAYAEAEKAAAEPPPVTVRTHQGVDYPVTVIDETPVDHQGVPHVKVRAEDGAEGYVPAAEVRQIEAPKTIKEAPDAPAADAPLPASAEARAAEARSEGVDLTRGQATRDFGVAEKEQTLSVTDGPEGQTVRDHFAKQGEQIKTAVERFKLAFGDTSLGATERGQAVKDALRELRDQGKAGVTALYKQAAEAAEALGEAGSNLIQFDTAPLLKAMREMFIDETVPEPTRKALKQQAAKYGLIGDNPRTIEGETTVTLRDSAGEPGGKVVFTGPQQRLTVVNAEDFRQKLSALYDATKANPQEGLKRILDEAVTGAVERAAEGTGGVGEAFKAARGAHQTQQQTFAAKDIVQKLINWKVKGVTEEVLPENAIKAIFANGPEGLTNLRKVKAVLLSKPTEASRGAWKAIQAHGVADIFKAALSPDDTVSGLKLNSAIKKFGADKLKVLLDPAEFNQLMKLRRVIGDATIPLPKTTNPSGSGYAVMRFLSNAAQNLAPVGRMVPMVRDIVKGAEEFAAGKTAKATAEGVTNFTGEATPKSDPIAWARKFLTVASSDEIIAPLIASAANEERA